MKCNGDLNTTESVSLSQWWRYKVSGTSLEAGQTRQLELDNCQDGHWRGRQLSLPGHHLPGHLRPPLCLRILLVQVSCILYLTLLSNITVQGLLVRKYPLCILYKGYPYHKKNLYLLMNCKNISSHFFSLIVSSFFSSCFLLKC